MNGYWAGVIVGVCASAVLFAVLSLTAVEQNERLRREVAELSERVSEHEEIMRAYEFYNWHNMKFLDEKED